MTKNVIEVDKGQITDLEQGGFNNGNKKTMIDVIEQLLQDEAMPNLENEYNYDFVHLILLQI